MKKPLRITIDVIVIIVGIVLLVLGVNDAIDKIESLKVADSLRFKKSYSYVDEDNRYKYVDLKAANKMLKKGTGILLIGSPEDPWTQVLVKHLDVLAKNIDIDISYLEKDDIDIESSAYKDFPIDIITVSTPHIALIKDGSLVKEISKEDIYGSEYEGAPIDYFTAERIETFNVLLEEISNLK